MIEQTVRNVVIVGGGTAGWLSAGLIAAKLGQASLGGNNAVSVTLVESPDVSTIGVGEGSWPSLRDTLREIGLNESQFLATCNASFKQGSTFKNWKYDSEPHQYQHPFTVPTGYGDIDTYSAWKQYCSNTSFERSFCLQPELCDLGYAPKQAATPDYAFVLNYGYHFDAAALATMLTSHCTASLGVEHVRAHIASVKAKENGFIESVVTKDGQEVKGDLFIDCSGSQSLLIEKHYKVKWKSVSHVLLNNRAMAVQVPYEDTDNAIASTTIATGNSCGWTWDIGLKHRRGVGMVYCSDFSGTDEVQSLLTDHLLERASKSSIDTLSFRELKFNPGYREQFWVKNCLSLGMSSGFIEPLEASAIAMVELGLRMLCEQFPKTESHMSVVSRRYNERFTYRWERVIDFLKLHYVLTERTSPYWQAQKAPTSVPDSLKALLELWQYQSPSRFDFYQNEEIFPSASYQYVLYGLGFDTLKTENVVASDKGRKVEAIANQLSQQQQKFKAALPSNRQLLDVIASRQ